MKTTTFLASGELQHNPDGNASRPLSVHVEWTPESESTIPIRSTWRMAIGALLTDHRIEHYQRLGRYGDEARLRILAQDVERAKEREAREERAREKNAILSRYV